MMGPFVRGIAARLRARLWTLDNYWIRSSLFRRAVLRASLAWQGVFSPRDRGRKIALVSDCIGAMIRDPGRARMFGGGDSAGAAHARRRFAARLAPSSAFRGTVSHHLMGPGSGGEERYFSPDDLARIETEHATKTKGGTPAVFADVHRERLAALYGLDGASPLPESYLIHAIPSFDPPEFVRKGAGFVLGERKLFEPREVIAVIDFLERRLRLRNPGNPLQAIVKFMKNAAIATALAIHFALLLFDAVIIAVGAVKNDYYFTLPFGDRAVETRDTPYARRAERIRLMNAGARLDNFISSVGPPPAVRSYAVADGAQIAVELNYRSYRSLRMQDQNGLTVLTIDWNALDRLATADRRRFRAITDGLVVMGRWDSVRAWIDDATGGALDLFRRENIPRGRICRDVTRRVMESPAPLEWIAEINRLAGAGVLTLLYHKPSSMKWADLDDIPRVMIDAVIAREDRRYRNDLFPVPHRGNDNLVIIPQITKKLVRRALAFGRDIGVRHGIDRLARVCGEYEARFISSVRDEARGGSSISNQVMEMLYTKFITSQSRRATFMERQIEQKEHELPASLAVDWFWTEDNILEAYVNEVYGGHHYGDIRGFRSQAEIYFMRGLGDLNLREQIMLVAAIKKPTRIRDYAQWLKAKELSGLIEGGCTRAEAGAWERENAAFRVDRRNCGDILASKEKARRWMERRIDNILRLLRENRDITEAEFRRASGQNISFRLAPGIEAADQRLANNIRRELERELGPERSDSGLVVVSTVDWEMQGKLQSLVDGSCRMLDVEPEFRVEGQPGSVQMEGGARIILASERTRSNNPSVVNRIVADVGGPSRSADEWDWVSLANRSLGSSLKPILDLYYILSGHGLQDMFRNSPVTYKTYTLEQQRILQNCIHRFPKRLSNIDEIQRYWSWSPRNFTEYTGDWVSVEDALIHSINGIHVQVQEIVTPEVFARFLNETMGISEPEGMHRPFRSIILGGSGGDQRYDRFLSAYSMFPNRGRLVKQTYLDTVRRPDGAVMRPSYRPFAGGLLGRYPAERVRAACLLIERALRDTVRHGTMRAMDGIGAGKTGTSNELRDALATAHFIAGGNTYIAGVRLGNRRNWSIGRAADRLAAPLLRAIITGTFGRRSLMGKDEYDTLLAKRAASDPEIILSNGRYCLKGGECRPRRIEVAKIQEEERAAFLAAADRSFEQERFEDAAGYYEGYLRLAVSFDSGQPAFNRMVTSHMEIDNFKRAGQIIERFARPGAIWRIKNSFERRYDVKLKADEDFYSGDDEYEKRKKERRVRKEKKKSKKKKTLH